MPLRFAFSPLNLQTEPFLQDRTEIAQIPKIVG